MTGAGGLGEEWPEVTSQHRGCEDWFMWTLWVSKQLWLLF